VARAYFAEFDQLGRIDARRARQEPGAQLGVGGVQRQRQRRLHRAARQPLEDAAVADGGEDQVLVADVAQRAEQLDRLEHVVQVVGRLAHAHEHHLFHRPQPLRASATWATISALPSWRSRPSRPVMQKVQPTAQPTWVDTHRPPAAAARSPPPGRRPVRQQQPGSRPRRRARCAGARARAFLRERGQGVAQFKREEILRPAAAEVERQRARPVAQHERFVRRLGADCAQALPDVVDLHG
jgi:hypothetical protein